MAILIDHITDEQADLIRRSHVFFVASARPRPRRGPRRPGRRQPLPQGRRRPPRHRPQHPRLLRLQRQRQRNRPPCHRRRSRDGHGHILRQRRRHRPPLRLGPAPDRSKSPFWPPTPSSSGPSKPQRPSARSSRSPSSARRPPAATASPSTSTRATAPATSEAVATSNRHSPETDGVIRPSTPYADPMGQRTCVRPSLPLSRRSHWCSLRQRPHAAAGTRPPRPRRRPHSTPRAITRPRATIARPPLRHSAALS